MIVVVGVAEQALVPRPVVLGAERVVDADEAAAGAHVLAQRGLGSVEMRLVRVLTASGIDRRPCSNSASRLVLEKITAL